MPADGVGNLTNAPLFADEADGDLHLRRDSPCINAGDNGSVSASTDLDGNPRPAREIRQVEEVSVGADGFPVR